MRCKKHYNDLSSINGVCATCLRQRLFILIQQQAQSQSQTLQQQQQHVEEEEEAYHHHKPTTTLFPRSVSPYRTRQQSVPDHRFFSTPQVGPTFSAPYCYTDNNHNNNNKQYDKHKKKKKSFIKFSLLTKLFRSKRNDTVSDLNSDRTVTGSATSSSSPSWFSIKSRRSKQPVTNRGMSPDCESNGYESCQQTPWRTPARRVNSTASGLTFCLSPLVRASPCRNWGNNTAAVTTVMAAYDGGENRSPVKAHLVNTKLFCANRSRKLADFGRLNPNR